MSPTISIASEDRDFFQRVADAAMANPFSERRDRLDGEIAGVRRPAAGDESILADALVETGARLRRLAGGDCWRLDEIRLGDREAVELAILFEAFHAHRDDFDVLLSRQRGRAEAVDFPFAGQLIDELEAHGIRAARSHRALELFYQMHRAFRFISDRLIGTAPSMRRLREALWNQVFTANVACYERFLWNRMEDFSTLLLGETGTGKTAAAAAIGRAGFIAFDPKRGRYAGGFDGLFSALNLSEFPVTLLESELFGHAKGAFTGAEREHEGALSRVPEHGTIFLDEIGELGIAEQVKLLRVLQERSYRPLGARSERRCQARRTRQDRSPLHQQPCERSPNRRHRKSPTSRTDRRTSRRCVRWQVSPLPGGQAFAARSLLPGWPVPPVRQVQDERHRPGQDRRW